MPNEADPKRIGLVEYLADLRADLSLAREQARDDAMEAVPEGQSGEVVWLGVEDVTVELQVVHEHSLNASLQSKIKGKFWVFAEAEVAAQASAAAKSIKTQTLTVVLRPRVETIDGESGRRTSGSVDVDDVVDDDEALP